MRLFTKIGFAAFSTQTEPPFLFLERRQPQLMIFKYGVDANLAGLIPAMLPFGTIFLTPFFGSIYAIRLFTLQIMSEDYKKNADSNAFLKQIEFPSRGATRRPFSGERFIPPSEEPDAGLRTSAADIEEDQLLYLSPYLSARTEPADLYRIQRT